MSEATRRCHTAIIDRQATAIIPIRKNGRPWKEDCPAAIARNETLRATRHYGRAFWKRWTGYHGVRGGKCHRALLGVDVLEIRQTLQVGPQVLARQVALETLPAEG